MTASKHTAMALATARAADEAPRISEAARIGQRLAARHFRDAQSRVVFAQVERNRLVVALEQTLKQCSAAAPRAGKFLFGNEVTLADVCLVPQMFNARRYDTDLSPIPTRVGISTH